MKIAILTLPLRVNYGGILQAYALQKVLSNLGHETVVIDAPREANYPPVWKWPLILLYRLFQKYIMKSDVTLLKEYIYNKELLVLEQNTHRFIEQNIKREVVDVLAKWDYSKFDAIIVGSDQIWRPDYYPNIENAFLDFTKGKDVKRYAYAVSFGIDEWIYTIDQTSKCAELAKLFNDISVREYAGKLLCERHLQVSPQLVLDPTLLLETEDYKKIIENYTIEEQYNPKDVVCYFLDNEEDKMNVARDFVRQFNMSLIQISMHNDHRKPLSSRVYWPVEAWLNSIYRSKLVLTDSYHATIFSIIFNKPFCVISNSVRGMSRVRSLLSLLKLESLIYDKIEDIVSLPQINWDAVEERLRSYKLSSLKFLKKIG